MQTKNSKRRLALYLRVSTAGQSRYGERQAFDQRPEVQEAPLRRLARARGWTVVAVYSDRASGARASRPELDRLLSDARRGAFDLVAVWRFDRLSRSVPHFLAVVAELRAANVDFVSHEQSFDTTTPMGQFCLTMFAALAELEREVIRERVRAGLDHARRNGTRSGRPIGRPSAVFRRDQVADLRAAGLSWREVAARLGVGVATVMRALHVPKPSTAAGKVGR